MKKTLLWCSLVVLLVLCISCKNTADVELNSPQQLIISELKQDDDTYRWKNVKWNSSIDEVEKQIGVKFTDTPHSSAEWASVAAGEIPEKFYDYRNGKDFQSVEYTAYINDDPLVIQYKDYEGYLTFWFMPSGVMKEMFYFSSVNDPYDSKMTYKDCDVEVIREELKKDLIEAFGEPTNVIESEYDGEQVVIEEWKSGDTRIVLEEGYGFEECIVLSNNLK